MFKIKLKTKAGNDVKKKQSFNVVFKTSFKKNVITGKAIGFYTFKIIYTGKVRDYEKVFMMKEETNLLTREDLILKVVLNLLTLVAKITQKDNLNPDLIMLNSTDLDIKNTNLVNYLVNSMKGQEISTKMLSKMSLPKDYEVFELIRKFCQFNENTRFMCINPETDVKYARSLEICKELGERLKGLNPKPQRIIDINGNPM